MICLTMIGISGSSICVRTLRGACLWLNNLGVETPSYAALPPPGTRCKHHKAGEEPHMTSAESPRKALLDKTRVVEHQVGVVPTQSNGCRIVKAPGAVGNKSSSRSFPGKVRFTIELNTNRHILFTL
jgi:hypothetical protein